MRRNLRAISKEWTFHRKVYRESKRTLIKVTLYQLRKRNTRRSWRAREPGEQNSTAIYAIPCPTGPRKVPRIEVLVRLRIDTCALKHRGRIHELDTQEISQKALRDALSSQWVDKWIAKMPTNGTRGHIRRDLRNHLLRCCVKPKKPWITTFRFDLDSVHNK